MFDAVTKVCLTAIVICAIIHDDSRCLTGHDIDATIQRNYQERETAPPLPTSTEKDQDE